MFNSNASSATAGDVNYIEDVFSTYLYTGTDLARTITNNIDLSTKGGLVWIKSRSFADNHNLFDTTRGSGKYLISNATNAQATDNTRLSAFTTSGFSLGTNGAVNGGDFTYASWTFREQPKFFDVVTYTGTGSNTTIAHALGSIPGCIIVKRTDTTSDWQVYHRSLANTEYLVLNTTAAKATGATRWNSTTPTSTVFSVGTDASVNASGGTYVAYVFANDAGGFGLSGADNVISCGSYTGNGSDTGPVITLGYEPQWVMVKRTDVGTNWIIFDTMRGMSNTASMLLYPNLSDDEGIGTQAWIAPTATGFQPRITNGAVNANSGTYIYIAIRRGPMKVPTSGTSVFTPVASRSSGTSQATPIFNAGFPVDTLISGLKAGGGSYWIPRLTVGQMTSSSTAAESSASATYNFGGMLGILSAGGDLSNATVCGWNFRRAPSFFDAVCYTGTGSTNTVLNHNLTVVPEMIIYKSRSLAVERWGVYTAPTGIGKVLILDDTNSAQTLTQRTLAVSSTTVTIGDNDEVNKSASTYVAYLFATCAGVSKVGSYTGTATTQVINCGFTGGARFVLIKRTDSTGDWYVWDSARGIVAGNDPYLLINSSAAEVTNTDYVDTAASGFELSSTAPAAINASGGTYIFLAIA
jgi:hypothetical protein